MGVAASLINRALGRHSTNQASQTATKKWTIPLEEMPRLEGILFTKSDPIAIINGARLSQGETFQYALSRGTIPITLAEIHPNSVLIHTPDQTPITLRIGGVGDKP